MPFLQSNRSRVTDTFSLCDNRDKLPNKQERLQPSDACAVDATWADKKRAFIQVKQKVYSADMINEL